MTKSREISLSSHDIRRLAEAYGACSLNGLDADVPMEDVLRPRYDACWLIRRMWYEFRPSSYWSVPCLCDLSRENAIKKFYEIFEQLLECA